MDIIRKYFPGINKVQEQQFQQFQASIIFWNQRINLVSRKDIEHLTERHILHSLAIARHAEFKPGDTILDVGTGGGFPGIPLAILFPEAEFTLIDSIGKKVNAVNQIVLDLGLTNVSCRKVRAENFSSKTRYVVSRAVTKLDRFADWIRTKIEPPFPDSTGNGIFYLKGGELGEELKSFKHARVYNLNELYTEPFFESKKLVYLPYEEPSTWGWYNFQLFFVLRKKTLLLQSEF